MIWNKKAEGGGREGSITALLLVWKQFLLTNLPGLVFSKRLGKGQTKRDLGEKRTDEGATRLIVGVEDWKVISEYLNK